MFDGGSDASVSAPLVVFDDAAVSASGGGFDLCDPLVSAVADQTVVAVEFRPERCSGDDHISPVPSRGGAHCPTCQAAIGIPGAFST